jgi:inosine-uridine nucleoside N-ribohydrolase
LRKICGRNDVPVAGGAAGLLLRKLVTASYYHGENGLAGVEFPAPVTKPVEEKAADLIVRLVRPSTSRRNHSCADWSADQYCA